MSSLDVNDFRALLNKRGKSELVEWIIEQADGNEDLRRALVSFVAPQADVAALVSELSQTISTAWGRMRNSREPWKLARPIASDLEPVLSALDQLIERGHAAAAEKVLCRFVETAEKGFDQIDDSYGYLGPLCQEAVTFWGKAWAKISPRDPLKLAQLVFKGVRANDYAIRDHIEVQRQCGVADTYAMPIARRLLDAGRAAEAIEFMGRADPARSYCHGEKDDYTTLRCKILQAMGRDSDARDTLWQEFRRGLNNTALDRLSYTASDRDYGSVRNAIGALICLLYGEQTETLKLALEHLDYNLCAGTQVADNPDYRLYYWYYATRCNYLRGGFVWEAWRSTMIRQLLKHRKADGSWQIGGEEESLGPRYSTALSVMILRICLNDVPGYLRQEVRGF